MSWQTVIVAAIIIGVVALAVFSIVRDKKKGKCSCGSCSGCAMNGACHSKDKSDK